MCSKNPFVAILKKKMKRRELGSKHSDFPNFSCFYFDIYLLHKFTNTDILHYKIFEVSLWC